MLHFFPILSSYLLVGEVNLCRKYSNIRRENVRQSPDPGRYGSSWPNREIMIAKTVAEKRGSRLTFVHDVSICIIAKTAKQERIDPTRNSGQNSGGEDGNRTRLNGFAGRIAELKIKDLPVHLFFRLFFCSSADSLQGEPPSGPHIRTLQRC
jgi:hypothetical protein